MKSAIVRARIEADLKEQAGEVLAANGLELSDAIRLFLRQVVLKGGLPFHVRAPRVKVASAEKLWQMKRASQARDRAIAAKMDLSGGQMLLVPPEEVREARVKWPKAKLSD
jgi:addiction module RelB/DinJ family antitoxin